MAELAAFRTPSKSSETLSLSFPFARFCCHSSIYFSSFSSSFRPAFSFSSTHTLAKAVCEGERAAFFPHVPRRKKERGGRTLSSGRLLLVCHRPAFWHKAVRVSPARSCMRDSLRVEEAPTSVGSSAEKLHGSMQPWDSGGGAVSLAGVRSLPLLSFSLSGLLFSL